MIKLFPAVMDLIFPPRCPFCDRVLENSGEAHCGTCGEKVTALPETGYSGMYFETCVAAYRYEDAVREAVLKYKFHGRRDYAVPFGTAVANAVSAAGITADILTWTPLGRKRLKERGYNQAEDVARTAAKRLSLKPAALLRRTRETEANSSMDSEEKRHKNVENAFEAVSPEKFANRSILLVDDVITTGATLNECTRELLKSGAESVVCAAVAAVRHIY